MDGSTLFAVVIVIATVGILGFALASPGQMIFIDSIVSNIIDGNVTDLNGLSDVNITAPSNGQVIIFDDGNWINVDLNAGGAGGGGVADGNAYSLGLISDANFWQIDLNTVGILRSDGNLLCDGNSCYDIDDLNLFNKDTNFQTYADFNTAYVSQIDGNTWYILKGDLNAIDVFVLDVNGFFDTNNVEFALDEVANLANQGVVGGDVNLSWKEPVLDKDLADPPTCGAAQEGDRYIISQTGADWYDEAWLYRQKIEIDKNSVWASWYNNVYFRINGDNQLFTKAQLTGKDIVFVRENNDDLLSFEIENYDPDANIFVAHISIPDLNADTNSIVYMYYGNPVGAAIPIANVWDRNFGYVYHMEGLGRDSTNNARNGVGVTGSPTPSVDPFYGFQTSFDGLADSISYKDVIYWEDEWDYANGHTSGFVFPEDSNRSHCVVFNSGSDITTRQTIMAEGGSSNGVLAPYIMDGNLWARTWSISTGYNSGFSDEDLTTPIAVDTNYTACLFWDCSNADLTTGKFQCNSGTYGFYVDANLIGVRSDHNLMNPHSGDGSIGCTGGSTCTQSKNFHDGTVAGAFFEGTIYEYRATDVGIDTNYNQTFYNNWLDFDNFLTLNDEETPSGSASGVWNGHEQDITECESSVYTFAGGPEIGWATMVLDEAQPYSYTTSLVWRPFGGGVDHKNLSGLLNCDEFGNCWHLNSAAELWSATNPSNDVNQGLMPVGAMTTLNAAYSGRIDDVVGITPIQVDLTNNILTVSTKQDSIWFTIQTTVGEAIIGEINTVTDVDSDGKTYFFDSNYDDPVIIATPISHRTSPGDDESATARITDYNCCSVTIKIQEPDVGADGTHGDENVSYIVMEAGDYELPNGTKVEAHRRVMTETYWDTSNSGFQTIDYNNSGYGSTAPTVLSQVMSDNDPNFVTTTHLSVSTTSFNLAMETAQNGTSDHGDENVGWIVWQNGVNTIGDLNFSATTTSNSITGHDDACSSHLHGLGIGSTPLVILMSQSTRDGGNGGWARYCSDDFQTNQTQVFLEIEEVDNGERSHTSEAVGVLVFDTNGTFVIPSSGEAIKPTGSDALTVLGTGGITTAVSGTTLTIDGTTVGGDNLGDHEATQDLALMENDINTLTNLTMDGNLLLDNQTNYGSSYILDSTTIASTQSIQSHYISQVSKMDNTRATASYYAQNDNTLGTGWLYGLSILQSDGAFNGKLAGIKINQFQSGYGMITDSPIVSDQNTFWINAIDGNAVFGARGTWLPTGGFSGFSNTLDTNSTLDVNGDIAFIRHDAELLRRYIIDTNSTDMILRDPIGTYTLAALALDTTLVSGDENHLVIVDGNIDFSDDMDDLFHIFNGVMLETIDVNVTSDGVTVDLEIEAEGGGDLTLVFSDEFSTFDTTPKATIALTVGSDASPTLNYIFIPQSTKVLTVNTTGFPNEQLAPVATVLVQSASSVQSDSAYKVHVWTDHSKSDTNQGHISHINEWIREQHATWVSGVVQTASVTTLGGLEDDVNFTTTSGVAFQLHRHAFRAFDDPHNYYVVNDSPNFRLITNLNDINALSDNTPIANNNYFSLVLWGVVSEDLNDSKLMVNLPSGTYVTSATAIEDRSKFTNFTIPSDFKGTGFLISRLTLRFQTVSSGTWTIVDEEDLRGQFPQTGAGGSQSFVTEFADNAFKIFDETDATKEFVFQADNITTATTRTYTAPDANGVLALTTELDGSIVHTTDTNASTACTNQEVLLGDGTCLSRFVLDTNITGGGTGLFDGNLFSIGIMDEDFNSFKIDVNAGGNDILDSNNVELTTMTMINDDYLWLDVSSTSDNQGLWLLTGVNKSQFIGLSNDLGFSKWGGWKLDDASDTFFLETNTDAVDIITSESGNDILNLKATNINFWGTPRSNSDLSQNLGTPNIRWQNFFTQDVNALLDVNAFRFCLRSDSCITSWSQAGGASFTDTNAETACTNQEVLLGSGACLSRFVLDTNIAAGGGVTDTNVWTEEFLDDSNFLVANWDIGTKRLIADDINSSNFCFEDGTGCISTKPMPNVWYGDSTDGNATITGAFTLTRDMFYENLTVTSAGHILTADFRIFVDGNLVLDSGGIIDNNGIAGGDGAAGGTGPGTQGAGGTVSVDPGLGWFFGAIDGVPGGAGGDWTAPGDAGTAGNLQLARSIYPTGSTIAGAAGGAGGGLGAGAGGLPGGVGTTTEITAINGGRLRNNYDLALGIFADRSTAARLMTWEYWLGYSNNGSGGGGGGGCIALDLSGTGGGGGSSGSTAGQVYIAAKRMFNNGAINAIGGKGGDGGAGGAGDSGGSDCGGGGGGGGTGGNGGQIMIVYDQYLGSGTFSAVGGALGATGGAGGGSFPGSAGSAGSAGLDGNVMIWTGH